MRGIVCSGLCALAPVLAATQPAATTVSASWSVQPSPNVRTFSNFLGGVAATSASNAWAVGDYLGSGTDQTLIEHWNGQSWAVQPSPNASSGRNNLTGVAATSAANAWAVGYFFEGSGIQTLIEHWNGQRWSVQPSPDLGAYNQFWGVAATSAANAWAVGSYANSTGPDRTLIAHWDGRTWAVQPSPNQGASASDLYSVAATSAANAWAAVPTLPGAALSAVSCPSPSACIAVGGSNSGTLAEQWNGTGWTILTTPNPAGAVQVFLDGVSCLSPSFCMATGAYFTSPSPSSPALPLAELWTGQKWTILFTPNPQGAMQAFLGGVSCTSASACTADGEQHSVTGIVHTLAERWNGTAWRIQPTPNPPGAPFASLADTGCTGPSACTAVGPTLTGLGWVILAERWNGTTWRIQPTPALAAAHNMNVPAVACPASTACIAVGGYEDDGPGSVTLAEQWQGGNTAPRAAMAPAGPGSACALPRLARTSVEWATPLTPSPWRGLRTATPAGNSAAAPPMLTWCRTR